MTVDPRQHSLAIANGRSVVRRRINVLWFGPLQRAELRGQIENDGAIASRLVLSRREFDSQVFHRLIRCGDVIAQLRDFIARGKHVAAICHGVSVLAWARVDGVSPLRGRTVAGYAGSSPGFRLDGMKYPDAEVPMRWHLEMNGASVLTSGAIGDPLSSTDDVWIDGKIITAENYDSAGRFAEVIAQALAAGRD